jgi:hypothetical protein
MSELGWGHGGPANTHSETGLADVLMAFASHGGQLAGARRWADNPLTLTHVRWQGPAGQILDAMRHPGDDAYVTAEERNAWVQLALHYPNTAPLSSPGPNAPWMALMLPPDQAQILATRIGRPRQSGHASSWPSRPASPYGQPSYPSYYPSRPSFPGGGPLSAPAFPNRQPMADLADLTDRATQSTEGWQAGARGPHEVAVTPCVEIELPPTMGGLATADYARDYARDVAMHFAQAARTIPYVRELRAWMRGERLVLAARMVLGPVGRSVSRAEMEQAAQALAAALTARTIPYIRVAFADPLEWEAGRPVPE